MNLLLWGCETSIIITLLLIILKFTQQVKIRFAQVFNWTSGLLLLPKHQAPSRREIIIQNILRQSRSHDRNRVNKILPSKWPVPGNAALHPHRSTDIFTFCLTSSQYPTLSNSYIRTFTILTTNLVLIFYMLTMAIKISRAIQNRWR